MPDPLDNLNALAERADRLSRRLEAANASRRRARTVSDPRGLVTLETDEGNNLARVRVAPSWHNLPAERFSQACVEAYRALGDAITEDWAAALDEAEDDEVAPAPRRAAPTVGSSIQLPPDEVLMAAMERTARQFEQLERLERARGGEAPDATEEGPVVGRSSTGDVTATFTADGMLTDVAVSPEWGSASAVRVGQALTEAIWDAVAQGQRLQAERKQNPYAELSAQFEESHAQTRQIMRRAGLI